MPEDQPSLPFDAQTLLPFDVPASAVAGGPPELRDEVAAASGLPLGERVEVTLRGAQVDALRGVLELATAPSYPWNPRDSCGSPDFPSAAAPSSSGQRCEAALQLIQPERSPA